MKSLISIIVPVYNTESYLSRCFDSLLAQHFENIEIIIVNDGSPDNSQQIIDGYIKKYPEKIKSLIKENGGLGSARNFGLDYARGEYIGFIDSDDYARPDMFEKLYARAKAEHADLVVCNMDMVDEDEQLLASTDISARDGSGLNEKQYALKYGRTEAPNKLYHRDLFMKTGIRYPAGWFEDFATTPLLIEAAGKIAYVPDSLMCYVQRKGSIMDQAGQFSDKYFDILKMTEILVNNKHRFNPEDYAFFMDNIAPVHAFLKYYLSIVCIKDKHIRNQVISQWGHELNRLLPGWEKSTAVKNALSKKTFFRRKFIQSVIWAFHFENTHSVNFRVVNTINRTVAQIFRKKND